MSPKDTELIRGGRTFLNSGFSIPGKTPVLTCWCLHKISFLLLVFCSCFLGLTSGTQESWVRSSELKDKLFYVSTPGCSAAAQTLLLSGLPGSHL